MHKAIAFLSLVVLTTPAAAAQNLNDWMQKGPASSGTWVVASDGQSVTQTLRADAAVTFFVSDKAYSDVELRYKVAVQTMRDDDHVGFVVGFRAPSTDAEADSIDSDFILIDWKKARQDFMGFITEEGLAISTFNGRFSSTSVSNDGDWPFWEHEPELGFDTLATAYGDTLGWEDNVVYDVTINYTPVRITVDVAGGMGAFLNGQRVFDVTGTFEPGSAGFYTYSQEDVLFVVEEIISVSVEEEAEIPSQYYLSEVYPNPFNPEARFMLRLVQAQQVRVAVYDLLGREVALLYKGLLGPSAHPFTLRGEGLPSGVYLVHVSGEHFAASRQAVLLK